MIPVPGTGLQFLTFVEERRSVKKQETDASTYQGKQGHCIVEYKRLQEYSLLYHMFIVVWQPVRVFLQ